MIILLLLLGVFTGILAGVFGIGGGVLFTPVLFFIFSSIGIEQPVVWTIGTSLFCTFTAALSSSIQQVKQRNSYISEGVKIGLLGALGVFIGKQITTSRFYTEEIFVLFFALLLLMVSWMFYRRGKGQVLTEKNEKPVRLKESFAAGLGGGFVAALAGVGGGIVVVPALNLGYKIDIAKTVSISSLAVLLISLSGWLQFAFLSGSIIGATEYTIGYVDFGTGLPLIIGAFAGGFIGVKAAKKIPEERRQIAFSVLAVIIAFLMVYSLW
ncbi:sulfite exporter TauE/SafE family protein [soil metagenome]